MGTNAAQFFTKEQKENINHAILNAELDTSGEIRIHIENNCPGDVMDRSAFLFEKLGMKKTQLRNGVLIYLALNHRKFSIVGDSGINAVVPENFWDAIKDEMITKFRKDEFTDGLILAVTKTGEQLKKYFPHQKNDVNELSDEISYGNN
jgi:uncharacterized membrane protein